MTEKFRSHQIEDNSCPSCHTKLDGATSLHAPEAKPKPDDVTVCMYCQAILQFGHEMELRKVTMDQFVKLPMEMQGHLLTLVHSIAAHRNQQEHDDDPNVS